MTTNYKSASGSEEPFKLIYVVLCLSDSIMKMLFGDI